MSDAKERPFDREWRLRRGYVKAWRDALPTYRPKLFVTLKTNRDMSEEALLRLVSQALHRLDQQKLNTKRPYQKPAYRRIAAFIFCERLNTNAHAHLLVWHPGKEGEDDTSLRSRILRHRDRHLLLGYGRDFDVAPDQPDEWDKSPVFERLWCALVPGGQYHARLTDDRLVTASGYSIKELWKSLEREPHFSNEFFSPEQAGRDQLQFCHPL